MAKKKLEKKYIYRRVGLVLVTVLLIFLLVKGCSDKKVTNKDNDANAVENVDGSKNSDNASSNQIDENKDENQTDNQTDNQTSEEKPSVDETVQQDSQVTAESSSKKTKGANYLENSKKDGVTENEDGLLVVDDQAALDVVCNKVRYLSSDYAPTDLVKITDIPTVLENPEVNQIREVAYDSLVELVAACKDEIGVQLYGRSGYRSYNTQTALYNGYVANHGQEAADTFSAKPGASEHQTGLAIDMTSKNMNYQLDTNFIDFEEGKWLADNAYKYGFIIRFPEGKEAITGYIYEPWHIRYLGKELAKEVFDSGLTLEEYMFGDKIDE